MRPYSNNPLLIVEYSIIIKTAKENLRPDFPPGVPLELERLIRRCWSRELASRPFCNKIVNKFKKLEKLYEANKAAWDGLRDTSSLSKTTIEALSEVSSVNPFKQQLTAKDLQFLESFFHLEDEDIDISDHIERGRSISLPENDFLQQMEEIHKVEEEKDKEQEKDKPDEGASEQQQQNEKDVKQEEGDKDKNEERQQEEKPKRKALGKDEKARVLLKMSSLPIGLILPKKPSPINSRPIRIKKLDSSPKEGEKERDEKVSPKTSPRDVPEKPKEKERISPRLLGRLKLNHSRDKEKEKEKESSDDDGEETDSVSSCEGTPEEKPGRLFAAYMGRCPLTPKPSAARGEHNDQQGGRKSPEAGRGGEPGREENQEGETEGAGSGMWW